eukprot:4467-Heterococcus_DN1.PRE.1
MRCLSGSCSSKSKTCAHVTAAGGAATSIGTTQSSKADTPTIDPTGPVNMQRQSTSVIPHYREDAPEVWDRMQAVLAQRHHGISGTASRYPSELCPHAYCEQACTHCYKPMQQFLLARASLIAIVKGEKDVFSPCSCCDDDPRVLVADGVVQGLQKKLSHWKTTDCGTYHIYYSSIYMRTLSCALVRCCTRTSGSRHADC